MMFSIDQYQAVRTGAGIVDCSARGKITVTGADRAEYLQGLLTNDIAALRPGTGCYAAFLTPQGRMIADFHVLALDDTMLLEVHPGVKDVLVQKFEEFVFTEDVQVVDWTGAWALFGLHGPRAASTVAAVLASGRSVDPPTVEQIASYPGHGSCLYIFHGASMIVARIDDVGEMGFHLYVERGQARYLHEALLASGGRDVNSETAEVLRIEAGRPEFRVDMDETTIPLEAGIEDRAVSVTKGCYVGQEVIARILIRGQGRVARKLVGLTLDAAILPPNGALLLRGEREAGRLTSVVFSETIGKPIALGYVHRDLTAPGSVVQILHAGHRLPATVTELPFVKGASVSRASRLTRP